MNLLEVPAVFAGLGLDRDDRRRVEVVALAHGAVEVGAGVTRREVDEAELGIGGRRMPYGAAAVLPDLVVLRPGLVAGLAAARDRVERPHELAVVGVERLHAAAHADLGAREARDHEAVVVQRRVRDREAVLPALGLHGPRDRACFGIEGYELSVEPPEKDATGAVGDAAARPAAADDVDSGIKVGAVRPEDRARRDIEREEIAGAGRHVNDAVDDERLRLARILRTYAGALELRAPHAFEVRDIAAVDLCQRRVALVVPIAAVRRPTRGRRGNERVARARVATADAKRGEHDGAERERSRSIHARLLSAATSSRRTPRRRESAQD